MYRAVMLSAAVALGLLALVLACDDDGPSVNSKCEKFCDALIESMENSMDSSESDHQIYIASPKEARKECELACTQTLDELGKSDKEAVEDCLECVADAASSSDDLYEFMTNIYDPDECYDECNDDDPGDDDPWGDLFEDDFFEDFDEHFSSGDPDVDVDMDIDGDGDMDGDGDSDADCPSNVVNDCGSVYLDCYDECAGDYDCNMYCYEDYCWCLESGGCDSAEYGC
jgi:hypothetical protein